MSRGNALKHNKRRNVGLVYSMLLKCLSESLVNKDNHRGELALETMKRFFADGMPLAQELSLHRVIQENRGIDEKLARNIICKVIDEANALDWRLIDIKKSNLIKEINYTFGQDFFDKYRVDEYRAIASTHLLIQQRKQKNIFESADRARIEESIIRYMATKPVLKVEHIDPDRNAMALKLAVEAFNEEYSRSLTKDQKTIIDAYVVGAVKGDYTRFERVVESRKVEICEGLRSYLGTDDVKKDAIFKERVELVLKSVSELRKGNNEQILEDIMLYQGVLDEIRSDR